MKANLTQTKTLVFIALFVALIIVGSYIIIPVGPVPLTFQILFVLLAGLLLGTKKGLAVVGVYFSMGLLGLPIFAGASSGYIIFLGPTGGFLAGFLLVVLIASLGYHRRFPTTKKGRVLRLIKISVVTIIAAFSIYIPGLFWLKKTLSLPSWSEAFALGFYPFIIGDLIKIILAVSLAFVFQPSFYQRLHEGVR